MSYGKMPKYAYLFTGTESREITKPAIRTVKTTVIIKRETVISRECVTSDGGSTPRTSPTNTDIVQMRENARNSIGSPSKSDAVAAFHALFTTGGTENVV